jgi:hypothetical protein
MRLPDALALRRMMAIRRPDLTYVVMRSGRRSLNVMPFYVAIDRKGK